MSARTWWERNEELLLKRTGLGALDSLSLECSIKSQKEEVVIADAFIQRSRLVFNSPLLKGLRLECRPRLFLRLYTVVDCIYTLFGLTTSSSSFTRERKWKETWHLPFRGGLDRSSDRSTGTGHDRSGAEAPADGQTPTVYPVVKIIIRYQLTSFYLACFLTRITHT